MPVKHFIFGFTIVISLSGFLEIEGKPGLVKMPTAARSVDLNSASKQNRGLKYSLKWSFGRKRQRGWHLYVPLIKNALATDEDEDSIGFARRVSDWQRNHDLSPTGVIDRATLFSFIDHWQSKRIKPVVLARQEHLIAAPISMFYDQTREKQLLKLEKSAFSAYRTMIAEAANDGSLFLKTGPDGTLMPDEEFLKIISSYRSPAYQASLRKREPLAGRAQIALKSAHFTGRALDIYVGGDPVSTRDSNRAVQIKTPVYRWLVENAARFGFYPYFYEPWHWEYVPENDRGP